MKQGKGTFVLTEQEHHDYRMRELAAKLKPPVIFVKGITPKGTPTIKVIDQLRNEQQSKF